MARSTQPTIQNLQATQAKQLRTPLAGDYSQTTFRRWQWDGQGKLGPRQMTGNMVPQIENFL